MFVRTDVDVVHVRPVFTGVDLVRVCPVTTVVDLFVSVM